MADGETWKYGDLYTKGNISILAFTLRGGATNNVWGMEEMRQRSETRGERCLRRIAPDGTIFTFCLPSCRLVILTGCPIL
jgi:hypothetical protein